MIQMQDMPKHSADMQSSNNRADGPVSMLMLAAEKGTAYLCARTRKTFLTLM